MCDIFTFVAYLMLQFNYDDVADETAMADMKTDEEWGGKPRPWNEPKIPMQQTKTGREKFEEAVGSLKVKYIHY